MMYRVVFFFFLFFSFLVGKSQDQTPAILDTTSIKLKMIQDKNDRNELLTIYGSQELSPGQMLQSSLYLLRRANSPNQVYESIYFLGVSYSQNDMLDSALMCLSYLMNNKLKVKDPDLLSTTNYSMGRICRNYGEKKLGLKYFKQAYQLGVIARNPYRIATVQVQLAMYDAEFGDAIRGIELLKQCEDIFFKLKVEPKLINTKFQIATVYNHIGNSVEAKKRLLELLEDIGDNSKFFSNKVICYSLLSIIEGNNEHYEKAIDYSKKAHDLAVKIEFEQHLVQTTENLSSFYAKTGDFVHEKFYSNFHDSLIKVLNTPEHQKRLNLVDWTNSLNKISQVDSFERGAQIGEKSTTSTFKSFLAMLMTCFICLFIFLLFGKKKIRLPGVINRKNFVQQGELNSTRESNLGLEISGVQIKKRKEQMDRHSRMEDGPSSTEGQEMGLTLEELTNYSFVLPDGIQNFQRKFDALYPGYIEYLLNLHPELTKSDLLIIQLNFLEIKSKNQSDMLGINMGSLRTARYRLKKKLKCEKSMNIMEYSKFTFANFQNKLS